MIKFIVYKLEIINIIIIGKKGGISSIEWCSNSEVWIIWGKVMKLCNLNGEFFK